MIDETAEHDDVVSPLSYLLLGLVAEASVRAVNESGNRATFLDLWNLAEQLTGSAHSYIEIERVLSQLIDERLIEVRHDCVGRSYRLCLPNRARTGLPLPIQATMAALCPPGGQPVYPRQIGKRGRLLP